MVYKNLIMARILSLRALTEPNAPYTRRAFTPMYQKGRELICQWLDELEIEHWLDSAGNLHARIAGKSPSTIYMGSHSDTVPNGGAYDGILGVVAGIELLRYVQMHDISLNYSLEFIDFLAEETTDWGLSCIGSRALTGALTDAHLALSHPKTGQSLKAAINDMGGDLTQGLPSLSLTGNDYFLELHIEQGPVLERLDLDIGIVTSLVGITRISVVIRGMSNHSGTTPMSMRQDSLVTASALIVKANLIAETLAVEAEKKGAYFVATVGHISNTPNVINVVPSKTEIIFDLRASDNEYIGEFTTLIEQEISLITQASAEKLLPVEINLSLLSHTEPINFDCDLAELCDSLAIEKGLTTKIMTSGAGHDAAFMAKRMKTLMIFIPSKEGISHNAAEYSSDKDIQQGSGLLIDLVLALNRRLDRRTTDVDPRNGQ